MSLTYYVSCKAKTDNKNSKIKTDNKKHVQQSNYIKCNNKKSTFISTNKKFQSGRSIVDKFVTALPIELHLLETDEVSSKTKKTSFCGSGIKLNKRLGPGNVPHNWSKPIYYLDQECYKHDLAYRDFKDPANRNIADKALISVANTFSKKTGISTLNKIDAKIVDKAMKLIKRK